MDRREKRIMRFHTDKYLFRVLADNLGEMMLLTPGRKPVEWMSDLLFMICKDELPVLDTCTGTLASAKTSLQVPEHRQLVAWEKYSACIQDALPSLVEV